MKNQNWIKDTIQHFTTNETLKEDIANTSKKFRDAYIMAMMGAPMENNPVNGKAGLIAMGSFSIPTLKKMVIILNSR
jgi:hypothetical protein